MVPFFRQQIHAVLAFLVVMCNSVSCYGSISEGNENICSLGFSFFLSASTPVINICNESMSFP